MIATHPSAPSAKRQNQAVIEPPETHYAPTADGGYVAYQVLGSGPLDLVFLYSASFHVELAWEVTTFARVFQRLASFSRLIRFDHRGRGMSDPIGPSDHPSLESRANEMLAVLDAAGSERAAVVANGSGGLWAIFFAATYPNRISSLVLDGCYARLARAPGYPCGVPTEVLEHALARVYGAFHRHGDPSSLGACATRRPGRWTIQCSCPSTGATTETRSPPRRSEPKLR